MKKFLNHLNEKEKQFETENEKKFNILNELIKKAKIKDLEANKYTLEEVQNYFLIMSKEALNKIINAHSGEIIGSTFSNELDVYELREIIVDILDEKRPTSVEKPSYKWLGVNSGIEIGVDNIKKTDDFEKLKGLKDYKIVTKSKDGKKEKIENIKIAYEPGKNTKYINIFTKEIGEFEDKPVLIILSSFPGKNGVDVVERDKFALYGYYFCSKLPEIAEMYDIEN